MIWFSVICAALAAAAIALVLRPLLLPGKKPQVDRRSANIAIYRDQLRELDADLAEGTLAQADYERSRRELEARLLEDVSVAEQAGRRSGRAAAVIAGIAIPVFALTLYLATGSPGAIDSRGEQVDAMVARLAAHLRENPDDGAGWKLLGRSHAALGRFPEAVDAYAKAVLRAPRDAQLLADFADALAMARGQRLEGEPEKLLSRALEIDPENLKALALAGTAAFDRRDFAGAAAYWQRMLPLVSADSEDARTIRANVEEARKLAAGGAGLRGKVEIAQKLKSRLQPGDTLFVYARAEKGPPMPLAVMRARADQLPVSFALDDSMAMAPQLALSKFPRVVVIARVSRSGQATAQPGDLQGTSPAVSNDASGIAIVIDTVVP